VKQGGWDLEIAGGVAPRPPGFLRHELRCPKVPRERPLTALAARGRMHRRRTVDLDIPRQVASPQSRTPFLQVRKTSIESHQRPKNNR